MNKKRQVACCKVVTNPPVYWEHEGAFSIELINRDDVIIAPKGTNVFGSSISSEHGRVRQYANGIELVVLGNRCYWNYSQIITIKNCCGTVLWSHDL